MAMMMLDRLRTLALRDLEALVVLSETRHFGRAAERMHMTQPALSALVRRVENALDQRLFDRSSRHCVPTADGVFAVDTIEHLLRGLRILEVRQPEAGQLVGAVRVGMIPTLGPYYVPHFLAPAMKTFPAARFQFIEGLTDHLIAAVRSRRIDVALLALPTHAEDLAEFPLFEEELALAVPVGHAAAASGRLAHADVPRQDLILLEPGHCLRTQTMELCGRAGGGAVPVHATGLEVLRFMVSAGVGCAVMPALAVNGDRHFRDLVVYRRFRTPVPTRTIALVSRSDAEGLRIAQPMASMLQGLDVPSALQEAPVARRRRHARAHRATRAKKDT